MKKHFLIPLMILFVFMGCKKNPVIIPTPPPPPPPVLNTPPNVSTGVNIQLVLPADSCILTATITTYGSKIKTYLWEKTSGPAAYTIDHADSLVTKVRSLMAGTYTFQLTVIDSSGLTGKASVHVSVIPVTAIEYNLDLNFKTGYKFYDNVEICPWDCYYADQTTIATSVQLPPSDNLQVYINEETDSSAQVHNVGYGYTAFRLSNQLYASGPSSFNLKKTIQQGGGSFSGTIHLNSSSALGTWKENAFKGLPPLTVTGNLDTTTRTVNMQIKGKIIF